MRATPLQSGIADAFQRHWPLVSMGVLVAMTALAATAIGDAELDQTLTEMLIRLVVVLSIYMFTGNSGVVSFGHIGFMAIGAYAEAWQTCCQLLKPTIMPGLPGFLLHMSVPFVPAILFSGLLAATVALCSGLFIMRLSGVALSIATFASLAIVQVVYSHWDRVTAGTSSIIGVPVILNALRATPWALAAMAAAYLFQNASVGLSLRAARDDEIAAKASGVSVFRTRLAAYVLSAFFAGIGGALYSHFLGILNPSVFYLSLTFVTLAMLVVGGIGSLAGAVLGVLTISFATELLRKVEQGVALGALTLHLPAGSQEVLLGAMMLLMLILRPRGLTDSREFEWPFKSANRSGSHRAAVDIAEQIHPPR